MKNKNYLEFYHEHKNKIDIVFDESASFLLSLLGHLGKATYDELSNHVEFSDGNLSGRLEPLEKEGLINIKDNSYVITPHGQELLSSLGLQNHFATFKIGVFWANEIMFVVINDIVLLLYKLFLKRPSYVDSQHSGKPCKIDTICTSPPKLSELPARINRVDQNTKDSIVSFGDKTLIEWSESHLSRTKKRISNFFPSSEEQTFPKSCNTSVQRCRIESAVERYEALGCVVCKLSGEWQPAKEKFDERVNGALTFVTKEQGHSGEISAVVSTMRKEGAPRQIDTIREFGEFAFKNKDKEKWMIANTWLMDMNISFLEKLVLARSEYSPFLRYVLKVKSLVGSMTELSKVVQRICSEKFLHKMVEIWHNLEKITVPINNEEAIEVSRKLDLLYINDIKPIEDDPEITNILRPGCIWPGCKCKNHEIDKHILVCMECGHGKPAMRAVSGLV